MTHRIREGGLEVAADLHRFMVDEAIPRTGIDVRTFWTGVDAIIREFAPRNRALLLRRRELQSAIDAYHREHQGSLGDLSSYEVFLRELGYLVEEPGDFSIGTTGVDVEVARQAGPQLVVPLLNARYAVNAANARWGSLYDALYGTDAISEEGEFARGQSYNPLRGAEVVARGRALLNDHVPLAGASHLDVTSYAVDGGGLKATVGDRAFRLVNGSQLVGYRGCASAPEAVVLTHHDLHLEIQVDRGHPIGSTDPAGVKDIFLESAVSTIMDLEDSVAAVDAADKILGYRNWLQLMQGTISARVMKDGVNFTRSLAPDRSYLSPAGTEVLLPGRSLLFIRQVGHLMSTDAVLDSDGNEVPEGVLDAIVTAVGSLHDLRREGGLANSRTGAMYVVKPKMHGPEEVAFANDLFDRIEDLLGLPRHTIKVGIMDEERRTSVNLKACIHAARDRIAFINTGFLDRTGDEIHTSMQAGPVVRKADMRVQPWIKAYEQSNVSVGLRCGLQGRAQIGKGMWAAPDSMAAMVEQKIAHPQAGASCAWVPSPTAATLHAIHYHQVDVRARQRELMGRQASALSELLTIPLGDSAEWSDDDRQAELDNNIQSTLGYVVRWVDAGVGCSKVPDLHGEQLMEDRATCRISSQHVANWLLHGVVTTEQVEQSLRRMALVVDGQNRDDPHYVPMAPTFEGQAFLAARDLLLEGVQQPSGYTEPVLHRRRRTVKGTDQGTGS